MHAHPHGKRPGTSGDAFRTMHHGGTHAHSLDGINIRDRHKQRDFILGLDVAHAKHVHINSGNSARMQLWTEQQGKLYKKALGHNLHPEQREQSEKLNARAAEEFRRAQNGLEDSTSADADGGGTTSGGNTTSPDDSPRTRAKKARHDRVQGRWDDLSGNQAKYVGKDLGHASEAEKVKF